MDRPATKRALGFSVPKSQPRDAGSKEPAPELGQHERLTERQPHSNRFGERVWNQERSGYVWVKSGLDYASHFMHSRNGWAFDTKIRATLLADKYFRSLRIETVDGRVFEASREDFALNVSDPFRFRRYPEQVVLPLSFWRVTPPEEAAA